MNRIQGKKIAVIGLGISNVSVVTYLLKHDIKQLSIFDTRNNPPYAEEVPSGVDLKLGPLDPEVLARYDMLVVSPGLSIKLPAIKAAQEAGVEIVGDIELFASEVNGKARVVGITGSNGKSTVTALVGFMLEKAGVSAAIGANFGHAVFDILSPRIDTYVLELSSFELETTSSLHLDAGVILNVSEDHLDRYDGDLEQYAEAKRRIFKCCDKIVVNRDDARTYPQDPAEKERIFASFGLDNQEYGREVGANTAYLCVNGQRVLDVRDLTICGSHNELNALAAMALADALGIPRDVQIQALKTFTGLEHRCQLVRILDSISFYNDSKATNVASAEAAINGLAPRYPQGIILLAGGIGKGQDFTPLKRFIGKEVTKVYCFGRDADKILALDPERCVGVLNMRQAIRMAFAEAQNGQAILLSPACSSFDQFKGFDERGRVFVNLVNNLNSERDRVYPTAQAEPKAPEPKAAPKAAPKAEVKAEVKAEPKAAPKAEVKAEAKAEPKAALKAEVKAEAKAEVKAEPKKTARGGHKSHSAKLHAKKA